MTKGTKRDAAEVIPKTVTATAKQPQKKPKVNPVIAGVNEAINEADGLPETCRAMLTTAAPGCLLTPANQRHEHQEFMVRTIGEVIDSIQVKMQGVVDAKNATITEAEVTRKNHGDTVKTACATLAVKAEEVTAKDLALDHAAESVLDAKAELTRAQSVKSAGDADLLEREGEKKELQDALTEHVGTLNDNCELEAGEATTHLDALLPFAKRLSVEESLISALPAACAKKPGERSGFDVMVIDQLKLHLTNRVAELTEALVNEAPAAAERAAAVTASEKVLEEANENHQHAAAELRKAQATRSEATSMFQAAEAMSAAFEREYMQFIKERDEKADELDNFQNYNMLCFTTLRDQTAEKEDSMAARTGTPDLASAGA